MAKRPKRAYRPTVGTKLPPRVTEMIETARGKRIGEKIKKELFLTPEQHTKVIYLAREAKNEILAERVKERVAEERRTGKSRHKLESPHLKSVYDTALIRPYKGKTPKQLFKKRFPQDVTSMAGKIRRVVAVIRRSILEVAQKGYSEVMSIYNRENRQDAKSFLFSDSRKMRPEEEMKVKEKGKEWKTLHRLMADIAARHEQITKELKDWGDYWDYVWMHGRLPKKGFFELKKNSIARFNDEPVDYELDKVITPLEMEILKDADEIMSKDYASEIIRETNFRAKVEKRLKEKLEREGIPKDAIDLIVEFPEVEEALE